MFVHFEDTVSVIAFVEHVNSRSRLDGSAVEHSHLSVGLACAVNQDGGNVLHSVHDSTH